MLKLSQEIENKYTSYIMWQPIKNLKATIAHRYYQEWLRENNYIDDNGYIKPQATLESLGKNLWETRMVTSLYWAWTRFTEGSLHFGPFTLHGANAMRFACRISTPNGHLCIRPPSFTFSGCYFPPYLYWSPDGTPRSAPWGWCAPGGADGASTRRNLAVRESSPT